MVSSPFSFQKSIPTPEICYFEGTRNRSHRIMHLKLFRFENNLSVRISCNKIFSVSVFPELTSKTFQLQPQLSNCSETFQLQRNFPTSKNLSNYGRFFPTSFGSFQLRWVLSKFARFLSLSLCSFQLKHKLPNFSFFPTALSNFTYPK